MSIQALLQKNVRQVIGPNLHLLISSLPSEYTVEVRDDAFFVYFLVLYIILDRNLSKN